MKRILFTTLTTVLLLAVSSQAIAKNADATSISDVQGSDKNTDKNEKKSGGQQQYLRRAFNCLENTIYDFPEGAACEHDCQCLGYCEGMRCYDGSEGDQCQKDSDCQSGLDCDWQDARLVCKKKKSEGQFCWTDSECEGYCERGRCYDGSEGDFCEKDSDCEGYCESGKCYDGSVGDRCQKDSDCQSGLDCDWKDARLVCKKKKSEGQFCWTDKECSGYCHDLKCWDGSSGDRCGSNRDCQSRRCRCTSWFCTRKRCR